MTGPASASVPTPPRGAVQRWATRVLELAGWRSEIAWPPVPKSVITFYPHTSNWDFVFGYLARLASGLPVRFMAKDELFRWPVAGLLRRMGGIPVNRRQHTAFTGQLDAEFERRSWLWLVIAPEGTRKATDHWKTGFYRIALSANVPVGLAFIDYAARQVGLRSYITLTGDEEVDLGRIRAAYAGKVGKYPANAGEIRFRHDPPFASRTSRSGR